MTCSRQYRRGFRGILPSVRLGASFDQTSCKSKSPSQFDFFVRHLTLIFVMIISRKMEHSMQNQNLNLVRDRMSKQARFMCRDIDRNGNVASKAICRIRRKRQYVCRPVLTPKARVQSARARISGDQNANCSAQSGSAACLERETGEGSRIQPRQLLFKNDCRIAQLHLRLNISKSERGRGMRPPL